MESAGREIHRVPLGKNESGRLKEILDSGGGSKECRLRAHILLLADEGRSDGGFVDADIARILDVGGSTVERTRKRCAMEDVPGVCGRDFGGGTVLISRDAPAAARGGASPGR